MGRSVHATAGGLHSREPLLAARIRVVRSNRRHMGDLLLPLVSRQSARTPECQRGGEGDAATSRTRNRIARSHPMGKIPALEDSLAALGAVYVPVLWLVFLHHLAADLFARGARRDLGEGRAAGRDSLVLWWPRLDLLRLPLYLPGAAHWRREGGAPGPGRHRVLRSFIMPGAFSPHLGSGVGDGCHGIRQFR